MPRICDIIFAMHCIYDNGCFIKVLPYYTCMANTKMKKNIEIRPLQALTGEHLTLVFPKKFALDLGIDNGDLLRCHIDRTQLIVEKANSQCLGDMVL
jgi:hypothetical protein